MTLVLLVIFVALAFEYINGFHDTANAIATSVATRVLTPTQAIILSASFNLIGAMVGTAVAKTIGQGMVDTSFINSSAIMCALIGAIIWNLFTWWIGLPSSSSHALIGGLCGAALAAAHGSWKAIKWVELKTKTVNEWAPATADVINAITNAHLSAGTNMVQMGTNAVKVVVPSGLSETVLMQTTKTVIEHAGVWHKVVKPMFLAPAAGIICGFIVMGLIYLLCRNIKPFIVNRTFGKLQLLSAAWMSYEHGRNDAQKTMGIIALTLFTATKAGTLNNLPGWLSFLHTPEFNIETWVKIACAIVIAMGTAAGGWKIIKTMGRNVVKMQPVHGFAAQTTAAAVIGVATHWGIPLSTTHVISGAIMGVGSSKRFSAVKWGVAERMLWAWIFTLPVTATLSYLLMRAAMLLGG